VHPDVTGTVLAGYLRSEAVGGRARESGVKCEDVGGPVGP